MLKLAEYKCYGDLITREQFQALALLMNVNFLLPYFSLIACIDSHMSKGP